MHYLELCCLISKYFGFSFYFSVIDLQLNFLVVREQTLYDFYSVKLVNVCFMPQKVMLVGNVGSEGTILVMLHVTLQRIYILLLDKIV